MYEVKDRQFQCETQMHQRELAVEQVPPSTAFTFVCWFIELAFDFVILSVFNKDCVVSIKSATCVYLFFVYP